jgi:ATP-dependent exoDNAse (exonuclease V) alpha subunit
VATALKKDLGIDSRATASWIASIKLGQEVFDERSILICDEAGLLSSREMHVLLDAVARSHAKLLLVGDRRQLQAIGAGPGLDLVIRAVDAARIDTIVRQRKIWAREAVANFGAGRAADALSAFAERGLLIEAHGAKAAVAAVIEHADRARARHPSGTVLILAKSNAAVAEISREIRNRRKAARLITGKEVSFTAATPSGHDIELQLAQGDMIRFLVRNDDLGVINSSIGKVLKIRQRGENKITITADIGSRSVSFDPMVLADQRGRPRIGWAYASTIAGAQGMTVDEAVMFLDAACNRHDVYVAASRARDTTTLVYDTTAIDRRLVSELPLDQQGDNLEFSDAQRREWLAERVSRASPKISTLDVIEPSQSIERVRDRSHQAYGVMFDR